MNPGLPIAVVAALLSSNILSAAARKKPAPEKTPSKADVEIATRPQIFLDRANSSPGKLDGHYGDFTWKALALYRLSRGEQPQQPPAEGKTKGNVAPDINGLDLASVGRSSSPTPSPKLTFKVSARRPGTCRNRQS